MNFIMADAEGAAPPADEPAGPPPPTSLDEIVAAVDAKYDNLSEDAIQNQARSYKLAPPPAVAVPAAEARAGPRVFGLLAYHPFQNEDSQRGLVKSFEVFFLETNRRVNQNPAADTVNLAHLRSDLLPDQITALNIQLGVQLFTVDVEQQLGQKTLREFLGRIQEPNGFCGAMEQEWFELDHQNPGMTPTFSFALSIRPPG